MTIPCPACGVNTVIFWVRRLPELSLMPNGQGEWVVILWHENRVWRADGEILLRDTITCGMHDCAGFPAKQWPFVNDETETNLWHVDDVTWMEMML